MLEVLKTVKMYAGGAFIRSESGRTYPFINKDGVEIARVPQASRKDFRNTVEIAKKGAASWNGKTAYLRSQIMYRMAEMMQSRFEDFVRVLESANIKNAKKEVEASIDTFVYYAGFCDKYQQSLGSVNPVAAPYHNFTTPENMGVVTLIDSDNFSLTKLIDNICSILVGGNAVIALVSDACPIIITELGEVFGTSDLPGGVVNLLSGKLDELQSHIATHMDVNAISFQNEREDIYFEMRSASIDNMKRIIAPKLDKRKSLDLILDYVEYKTVWHPIEPGVGSGGAY